ncbi:hypothetical protein ABVT39_019022 [Epinephelus coioides]
MAASSKKPASLRSQTKEDDSNKYDDILHAIKSMESRISNNIKSLEETIADKVTAAVREKMEIIRQEFKEDIVELYSRVTKLEAIMKHHPFLDPQLSSEVGDFNARLKVLEDAVGATPGPSAPGVSSDLVLNVVIRNLPHRVNERAIESSFHAILKEIGTDKPAVRGGRVNTTRPTCSNPTAGEAARR